MQKYGCNAWVTDLFRRYLCTGKKKCSDNVPWELSKSKYSTEEGRSISTSGLGEANGNNNKHPFGCASALANSNLSCDRASQASRLREVLAGPIWRAPGLLFFPEANWNWSRTNIKPPALPVDNLRCAGSKQTTKSYHEGVGGTKSHNNDPPTFHSYFQSLMVWFPPFAACWRLLDLRSRRWLCC